MTLDDFRMNTRSSPPSCFPVAVVLFLDACFLIGTVKAMGVLLNDISKSLYTTATDLGIALGLFMAFNFVTSPFIIVIYNRMSRPRILILIGAIFSSTPVVFLSLATSNMMLYILFAIAGTGHAIVSYCGTIFMDAIAGKRFNFIFALSMCGYSAGMVLFPLMADELLSVYGWRPAVLILGSIMLNLVPAVMTIKTPPQTTELPLDDAVKDHPSQDHSSLCNVNMTTREGKESEENNENTDNSDTSEAPLLSSANGHDDRPSLTPEEYNMSNDRPNPENNTMKMVSQWFQRTDFYKDPYFNFMLLSHWIHEFVYSGWHTFLVPHSLQRGISIDRTVIMTFCAAIGNFAGRLMVAFLTHDILEPINMHLAVTLLNFTALMCDAFIPNFYVMLATSCCSAGAIAGRAILGLLVARKRTSPGNFPISLCALQFGAGCFSLLGGYTSGLIADLFSTYDATFKLLAGMDVLVFVFMLVPRIVKKPMSSNI